MPIYEYECPKCGKVFEEWGKAAESHKHEECPACKTPSPRIMSRTSFVLKGNGWYVSDYGYRKGITEEGNSSSKTPAKSTPVTPAKQGEKSLAASAAAKPGAASAKAPEKKAEKTVSTAEK